MSDRTISPQGRPEEVVVDAALRPRTLDEMLGQDRLPRKPAHPHPGCPPRNEPLDHVLFYGPPGLGKTSLAWVLSHEMDVGMKVSSGPAIERAGDLAAILTNLRQGDILFIDEVHRLGHAVEEVLYPAMEDFALDIVVGKGPSARNIRLKLPRFTLVGATTRLALMTAPLRARFGAVYRFDFYDLPAMEAIAQPRRGCSRRRPHPKASTKSPAAAAAPHASRCACCAVRGTSRRCGRKGRSPRTVHARRWPCWTSTTWGWTTLDRGVLGRIIRDFRGGPVGLETIAAALSEESDTIMDVVEPYLLQLGFLERTPRGRVATRKAYEHLGEPYPEMAEQPGLFEPE